MTRSLKKVARTFDTVRFLCNLYLCPLVVTELLYEKKNHQYLYQTYRKQLYNTRPGLWVSASVQGFANLSDATSQDRNMCENIRFLVNRRWTRSIVTMSSIVYGDQITELCSNSGLA